MLYFSFISFISHQNLQFKEASGLNAVNIFYLNSSKLQSKRVSLMSLAGSSIDVFTEIFLMTSNRNYGGVQGHDLAGVLGNIDFPATSILLSVF